MAFSPVSGSALPCIHQPVVVLSVDDCTIFPVKVDVDKFVIRYVIQVVCVKDDNRELFWRTKELGKRGCF